MDHIALRRTLLQILNYSSLCDQEHHFVVHGLGVFHVNETKKDAGLDVDVWLQASIGKRIWITYSNLDLALDELIRHPA